MNCPLWHKRITNYAMCFGYWATLNSCENAKESWPNAMYSALLCEVWLGCLFLAAFFAAMKQTKMGPWRMVMLCFQTGCTL